VKWDDLRYYDAEKGINFLMLCGLRRTRDYWLELLHEPLNCEIIKYCDVIIYVCIHVHMYGDVN
jgi:hypothetical protein